MLIRVLFDTVLKNIKKGLLGYIPITPYILKGTGEVNDDGILSPVGPGDVVHTGSGHSHSIRNTGEENLELIAMILFEA